jgi:hypothetical protein
MCVISFFMFLLICNLLVSMSLIMLMVSRFGISVYLFFMSERYSRVFVNSDALCVIK